MQPLDAERVKEWRHRRMLSQQEVADRAGTSLFTIQRIERGEGNVRPKTGRGVAAALGVPVEELLPKVQAPLFRELPEQDLAEPEERREAVYDIALSAAKGQAEQDRQAVNRTLASEGIPQPPYFKEYENQAIHRLLGYPPDELAGALMELAVQIVRLEEALAATDTPLSLEDFPAEQVAAFLAENERENERIKRELEKLTPGEIKEMMLASPPLRRIRDAYAENEKRRTQDRSEVS